MTLWSEITEAIESATGEPFHPEPPQAVGGGCINEARSLSDGRRSYFVKTNGSNRLPMFEAEAAGLDLLRRPEGVRVPEPVCHGSAGDTAYLVLEYIPMGRPGADGWARMGAGLAAIHASAAATSNWVTSAILSVCQPYSSARSRASPPTCWPTSVLEAVA